MNVQRSFSTSNCMPCACIVGPCTPVIVHMLTRPCVLLQAQHQAWKVRTRWIHLGPQSHQHPLFEVPPPPASPWRRSCCKDRNQVSISTQRHQQFFAEIQTGKGSGEFDWRGKLWGVALLPLALRGQAWSWPSPRGQWRTEKTGGNWLHCHL